MTLGAGCPNPRCGHTSRLEGDPLGRRFRCPRCAARLSPAPPPGGWGADWRPRLAATAHLWGASKTEAAVGPAEGSRGDDPYLNSSAPAGPPPSRLGRYRVRSVLGTGTSATVYLAEDPDLEREVALKVLHTPLAGTRSESRLQAEARALARIRHPRVAPVYEVGRFGRAPFLATAYIRGRSLERVLEEAPVDNRTAARLVCELAETLADIHELGVVHRDIKPSNLIVDAGGQVHLADFGLAYRLEADARLTVDGAILGTPAYVAPEAALGGDGRPQPASDQYSLGVVLYEMLCGRPPFLGPPAAVLYRAIHEEPAAPRSVDPRIPQALERICLRALAKSPDGRFGSCRELAATMGEWLRPSKAAPAAFDVRERYGPWRPRKTG